MGGELGGGCGPGSGRRLASSRSEWLRNLERPGSAAPLAAGGGAGRVTRGADQWGARPGPSLLRAFAALVASREPPGESAE